jgi:hypothetical protein
MNETELMLDYWQGCFQKYGQHLPSCLKTIPRSPRDRRRFDCTCGYEAALRTGNMPVPEIRKTIPTAPQLVRMNQEIEFLAERAALVEALGEKAAREAKQDFKKTLVPK